MTYKELQIGKKYKVDYECDKIAHYFKIDQAHGYVESSFLNETCVGFDNALSKDDVYIEVK